MGRRKNHLVYYSIRVILSSKMTAFADADNGTTLKAATDCQQPNVKRADSALRTNIAEKGENAYYFAHDRQFVVPEDAKVVSGPGLVTGGAPTLISKEVVAEESTPCRTEWIKDLSWADDGAKVKVYLQLPSDVKIVEEDQVKVDFQEKAVDVCVRITENLVHRCKIDPLNADIAPDLSTYRVSLGKGKVSLTLKKRKEYTWYDLKTKR